MNRVVPSAIKQPSGETPSADAACCFHCGKPLHSERVFHATIDETPRAVCSQRCAEVVTAIEQSGLSQFYRERRQDRHEPQRLQAEALGHLEMYDDPGFQTQFVEQTSGNEKQASLLVDGITCAACVRLVESRLHELDGVRSIAVNATTHRAELAWDAARVKLSEFMREIYALGYAAYPFDPGRRQLMLESDRKTLLQRLALATLFGMQIMMFTVALYYGEWLGMSAGIEQLLRWASLALSVPIIGYCAVPFFAGAARGLRNKHLGMDVPVSLALLIAFAASGTAVILGSGHTYFESVAMFVALLLASRYFELSARIKTTRRFDDLAKILPNVVTRLNPDGSTDSIMASNLRIDDVVLVRAGETIPIDGVVVAGSTTVDEALVSGESMPVSKRHDSEVLGGSVNVDSPIQVQATRIADESLINEISRLAQRSQSLKPQVTILANRIASWFIAGVIGIASAVALYWWSVDSARVLPVTMAVLIISCPCALALATPAAMTAGSGAMLRNGVAVLNPSVVEILAGAKSFIFDKTGTLTTGNLHLTRIELLGDHDENYVREIAAALSLHSEHTIGRALRGCCQSNQPFAEAVENFPGAGISGIVNGTRYWMGSASFIRENTAAVPRQIDMADATAVEKSTYLADDNGLLAALYLSDELKAGARDLITSLQAQGANAAIFSGDNERAARAVAAALDIHDVQAGLGPEAKLEELDRRQRNNEATVVIGDGINDAPMLAQAYVSIAVGNASELAKRQADVVLLRDDLRAFEDALKISKKTMRIIRQNIGWAIAYNSCALPLAIAGFVPPWLAAIGMSLSSLLVVANATRINRSAG